MTPFGTTVARELRSALVPIGTASIVDYSFLGSTLRALIRNALFYVEPAAPIEQARDTALETVDALAAAIRDFGVQPQGISLTVDRARADAMVAVDALIDAAADAEPTTVARCLGIA